MKNVKISSVLTNELDEKSYCNVIGTYDEQNNVLDYYDSNIRVTVLIDHNLVCMFRDHPEYNLSLNFDREKTMKTKYLLKATNMNLNIEVKTINLVSTENIINIKYILYLNEQNMGVFNYKLCFEVIS